MRLGTTLRTSPGGRPRPARARLQRTLASVLAAVALLAAAAPAQAAPLALTHELGPQAAALSTPLIVHDDFEASRTLNGRAALAPAGAVWAATAGTWSASGGEAASSSNGSALTVDGGVPAVDVTAVLESPGSVFGLLTVAGTVRWGIAAQSGPAGRLEGGLRCDVTVALGISTRACVFGLYGLVNGVDTELCTLPVPMPDTSRSAQQVRLRTSGSTATLSLTTSSSSCTAAVPSALRTQTRVGVGVTSSVALNLLGSPSLVLQVTAVPAVWALP